MSRAVLILTNHDVRDRAIDWIKRAAPFSRIEFKGPKRTIPQNDRMWAMLTDVATQVKHHDLRLSPDDWKLIFLDALKREVRMVPNLEGTGLVSLGRSSSDLSVAEMGDLMTLIEAYGAQHGVVWHDREGVAA